MARYKDADGRLCRREGMKPYLKGDRCYTPKCYRQTRLCPGPTVRCAANFRIWITAERKQKARRTYGF